MNSQKKLGEYTIGDKVMILGSEGVVIDIIENECMILIKSSRGLTKVSPTATNTTLKKIPMETTEIDAFSPSNPEYQETLYNLKINKDYQPSPYSLEKEHFSLTPTQDESDTHYCKIKNDNSGEFIDKFTNKYVCVVQIDDGRIYVDYHFEEGNRPFGEGRILNRIYINGVTTVKGKQIPGSTKRLKLIDFYPCETIDEIKIVFENVFNEYREKYQNHVFRQKKFLSEEIKQIKQKKQREMEIIEGASFKINSLEQFYNNLCSSEEEMFSYYLSKADFSDLNKALKWDPLENCSNFSFEVKYFKKESMIIDKSYIQISYSSAGIDYRANMYMTKILEDNDCWNDDQVYFINEKGNTFNIDIGWTNNSKHTRIQFVLSQEDSFSKGIEIFSSNEVSLVFRGLDYPLLEKQRKMILHSFWISRAYYLQLNRKNNYESKRWLSRKYFNSLEISRYDQRKSVHFVSIDRQNESAVVKSYQEFFTTLFNCTCPHFQEPSLFCPCEHMFALALELNKCNKHPKLNLALDAEIRPIDEFVRIMFLGSNKVKTECTCISRYYNKSLDSKFIKIKANDSTLYLGDYWGYIEDEDLDCPDKYYSVLLNDSIIGRIYKEEKKKKYYYDDEDYNEWEDEDIEEDYRLFFSSDANNAILTELANNTSCEISIIDSAKQIKSILIKNAFGVSALFCDIFYPKGTIWKEESEE